MLGVSNNKTSILSRLEVYLNPEHFQESYRALSLPLGRALKMIEFELLPPLNKKAFFKILKSLLKLKFEQYLGVGPRG